MCDAANACDRSWRSNALAFALERDSRALERYSRHLVLPSGAELQRALSRSRVLVVGCGGLGSPCAIYLATSGVGVVGACDFDDVELSNLHRQIAHGVADVGSRKSASLKRALEALNDGVEVIEHDVRVCATNALDLVRAYDVVCDCTDDPRVRYALSDACAAAVKPLVSAAALGVEGQLSVYCARKSRESKESGEFKWERAPCYRCVFPTPASARDRGTCGANGVLGVVPGVMGTLQALEAIKTIAGVGESMSGKLMVFDAMSARPTRTLNLASEINATCERCGVENFDIATYDYDAFLSAPCSSSESVARDAPSARESGLDIFAAPPHGPGATIDAELQRNGPWKRLSAKEFDESAFDCVIDVRPHRLFDLAALSRSVSIPIDVLDGERARETIESRFARDGTSSVCFVCASGNNSQRAADWFARTDLGKRARVFDLSGGLASYRREVDPTFPRLD